MASYLWKKLSESEKKEIENQAKEMILGFGDALETLKDIPESFVDREEFERREDSEIGCDIDRNLMFENAPEKDDEFIIAEKGGWVE